jgi:hypothetical protein
VLELRPVGGRGGTAERAYCSKAARTARTVNASKSVAVYVAGVVMRLAAMAWSSWSSAEGGRGAGLGIYIGLREPFSAGDVVCLCEHVCFEANPCPGGGSGIGLLEYPLVS